MTIQNPNTSIPGSDAQHLQTALPAQSNSGASGSVLTIVVPCHNEELALPGTSSQLIALLEALTHEELIVKPAIFFVDDGSTDDTWRVIEKLAVEDPRIHG